MKRSALFKPASVAMSLGRIALVALSVAGAAFPAPSFAADVNATKPTVVLVQGALADSSSWNGVVSVLTKEGYTVVAAANPLRSLKGDASAVSDVVKSVKGPVVLVGHSYGGAVISDAAVGNDNVKEIGRASCRE